MSRTRCIYKGFVTLRTLVFLLAFSSLFVAPRARRAKAGDAEIRAAIADLGSRSLSRSFEVFYSNPQESTRILIGELKATKRGHYLTGQHPHAVWIVRALRSLTGLDFQARTEEDLSADESHFLALNAKRKGELEFFGTWMSRDSVWVAPKDAQLEIIREWKEWYARYGRSYKYVNDHNVDDWYF